jgi:hypothetical protein
MRYFVFATAFLVTATPAFAVAPDAWQKELQSNLQSMTGSSVNVTSSGPVKVTPQGANLRAELPAITVKNDDGTSWQIPSIIMTRPVTGDALAITVPKNVTRSKAGVAVGMVMIGQQNLTGTWNDKTSRFDALQGELKNINIQQNDNSTKAAIDTIDIATPSAGAMKIVLNNLQGSSFIDNKTHAMQVGHLDYTYQFKGAQGLGIEQILGLLQQNYLAMSKTPVAMTAHATSVSYQNNEKASNTLQDIMAEVLVTPKGDNKTADVKNHIEITGISRSPAAINNLMMPKNLQMTGTVLKLPLAMLSMSPTNNNQTLKQEMANAGTVVNFDDIRMETAQGGKMTGAGRLTASATTPTGFTGLINFKLENISNVMANLQKQMSAPGATMANQGQAMMGMMMLQGLGTQQNQTTQYALNLTPDGQTLVNGQDISGLVNLGMGLNGPAAAGAVSGGANALGGVIGSFMNQGAASDPVQGR